MLYVQVVCSTLQACVQGGLHRGAQLWTVLCRRTLHSTHTLYISSISTAEDVLGRKCCVYTCFYSVLRSFMYINVSSSYVIQNSIVYTVYKQHYI